jgi:hypothetical protein
MTFLELVSGNLAQLSVCSLNMILEWAKSVMSQGVPAAEKREQLIANPFGYAVMGGRVIS